MKPVVKNRRTVTWDFLDKKIVIHNAKAFRHHKMCNTRIARRELKRETALDSNR